MTTLPAGARNPRRVGGGDINEAWRVELADGREAFVKTRSDAALGEYALEAEALRWLGEPGTLAVPRVLEVNERYLALEWIEQGRLSAEGAELLGRGLARVHGAGAPRFGDPGFAQRLGLEARIGSLRLPNHPAPDWASFYAQRRLLPLARIASDRGALSSCMRCCSGAPTARLPSGWRCATPADRRAPRTARVACHPQIDVPSTILGARLPS